MKYCPYCGAPLQDSAASFCSECGQKLVPVQEEGCSEQKKKRFPPFLRAKKQKQQASDSVVSEQEPAPPDRGLAGMQKPIGTMTGTMMTYCPPIWAKRENRWIGRL